MAEQHLCVAIYGSPDQADEAFARLRTEGSNMSKLSFVGRDYWSAMIGSRHAGERFLYLGVLGPFWQRLWAGMGRWGVFWFFDDGPVLVAGSLVRSIIATQEEGRGDTTTSLFARGLAGTGIPPLDLAEYEQALIDNRILVFIQGTLAEIEVAQGILNQTKAINHTIHHSA